MSRSDKRLGGRRRGAAWLLAVISAVLVDIALFPACCSLLDERGLPPHLAMDPFADRTLRYDGGQLWYLSRTVAGATPIDYVYPPFSFKPRLVVRSMESNLAGFTFVSTPIWPLIAIVGSPAWFWVGREWVRRARGWIARRQDRRRGFDSISATADARRTRS